MCVVFIGIRQNAYLFVFIKRRIKKKDSNCSGYFIFVSPSALLVVSDVGIVCLKGEDGNIYGIYGYFDVLGCARQGSF